MQLIKKMFGRSPGTGTASGSESAQFQDSDINSDSGSRNAPRRELVHVVLRDSMRRHGIPSAWIECRILSVVTRSQRAGMHVQFIVRDGVDRLLTYVPAFQTSFLEEIARFDPRMDDWLFSLSWQFVHFSPKAASSMPDPAVWAATTAGSPLQAQAPIPSAVTPEPAGPVAAKPAAVAVPTKVRGSPRSASPVAGAVAAPGQAAVGADRDEEVMEDLLALYAIRDAAMRQGRPGESGPAGERDFESTHPGGEPDAVPPPPPPRNW